MTNGLQAHVHTERDRIGGHTVVAVEIVGSLSASVEWEK